MRLSEKERKPVPRLSMIEMAMTNGLNIYKYLTYVLEHHPSANMTGKQLARLALWSQ